MIQSTICQIGVKLYSTHFLMMEVLWYELENLEQNTWNKTAHKNNFCFSRKSFISELQFDQTENSVKLISRISQQMYEWKLSKS